MHRYFRQMPPLDLGRDPAPDQANRQRLAAIEQEIAALAAAPRQAGTPDEDVHRRGQLTVWERLAALVEPGSLRPLLSLYDPEQNEEGLTGVVCALGRISGRWCVVAGFDNKSLAGAWLPGQPEKKLRVTDLATRLRLPLVWLVNCSGVKLSQQHRVYGGRRGGGANFFRHAEMAVAGLPVLAGVFGSNPAGGGYQACSPTLIIAHDKAEMSAGGGAVLGGMGGAGPFDIDQAMELIAEMARRQADPPGTAATHFDVTGFFREIYPSEPEVLAALQQRVAQLPAFDPAFFRVDEPAPPLAPADELYDILPLDNDRPYKIEQILARLVDGSSHREYRRDFGPEIYCGLVKLAGLAVGLVANRQGELPAGYPAYAAGAYQGRGGTIFRDGLLKMAEFTTLCGRDRLPMIWLQDHDGLDLGDLAERAEVLGLGQSLVYSIQQSGLPMLAVVLRKGTVAPHYQMGGPPANRNNALTLGLASSEIYVMRPRTAAAAALGRKLARQHEKGLPLEPVIARMNAMIADYHDKARPAYLAQAGLVDEVARLADLRDYLTAFAEAAYQNPASLCPQHQMILPRLCAL